METESKLTLRKAILVTVAATGLIAVAAAAPNALQLLRFTKKYRYYYQRKYRANRILQDLQKRSLVTFKTNHQGQKCVALTNQGKDELRKYQLQELKIKKPRRWDGKYRLVMFDIKEWKRLKRDHLRQWLEHLGFVRMQGSVWVYPYDCQEVVMLLKSYFGLGKEVIYATVDNLSNDRWLRHKFAL